MPLAPSRRAPAPSVGPTPARRRVGRVVWALCRGRGWWGMAHAMGSSEGWGGGGWGSASGSEAEVGELGGGEGVVPGVGEGAVAGVGRGGGIRPLFAGLPLALPVREEADDLVMAAADEVPPHD